MSDTVSLSNKSNATGDLPSPDINVRTHIRRIESMKVSSPSKSSGKYPPPTSQKSPYSLSSTTGSNSSSSGKSPTVASSTSVKTPTSGGKNPPVTSYPPVTRSLLRSSSAQNMSKFVSDNASVTSQTSRTSQNSKTSQSSRSSMSVEKSLTKSKSFRDTRTSSNGSVSARSSIYSVDSDMQSRPEWNNDFNLLSGDKEKDKVPLLRKGPLISTSRASFRLSTPDPKKKAVSTPINSKTKKIDAGASNGSKADLPHHTAAFPEKTEHFAEANPLIDNAPADDSTTVESPRSLFTRNNSVSPSKKVPRYLSGQTFSSAAKSKVSTASTEEKLASIPLYAERYGTAAEAIHAFHESLRSSSTFSQPNMKPAFVAGSNRPGTTTITVPTGSIGKGFSLASFGNRASGKFGKKGATYNEDAETFLKQVRAQRKGDGKPTKGSIEEQWLFLKTYFKMADDDLEWLMVAKHKGAYKYAKNKHDVAEDKYFKSLYDQDILARQKKEFLESSNGIGEIPNIIRRLSELHMSNLVVDPVTLTTFNTCRDELKSELQRMEQQEGEEFMKKIFSAQTMEMFKIILSDVILPSKAVRKAKDLHVAITDEMNKINRMIHEAKQASDDALNEMEKWSRRSKEADEYATVMKEEEELWLEKEYEQNQEALSIMRSFIPVNIADMSINDLINEAKKRGGWYSLDLASELKNNRLLHWVVTHKEDIAMANFLAGEKKAFFENIESLDIIELRAIVVCLPDKFELDNDGRKNEWRSRFIGRVRQLVSQQHGETVKGGWDGPKQKRIEVKLAPLKPEQERRSIYFYRSKEQCVQKIKQYDDKEAALKKKSGWFAAAKIEAEDAKREYDTILNEMRDPDFKEQYGAEQIAMAKKLAKEQWNEAESKRRGLEREVSQLKSSIASNPISREDFIKGVEETEAYLKSQNIDWEAPDQPPITIKGVFETMPEISRTVRAATKFVSAEQEAEIRKNEILALKAKKDTPQVAETTPAPETEQDATAIVDGVTSNDDPATSSEDTPPSDSNELKPKVDIEFSETATRPSAIRRRQSVLESSNPDMINKLTQMMGGSTEGGAVSFKPIRRASVSAIPAKTETAEEKKPKEIKVTKSKFLQKIAAGNAPAEDTSTSSRPAAPSFLDQLKSRGKNPFAAALAGGGGDDDGKPKSSFLDQIKAKSKATA